MHRFGLHVFAFVFLTSCVNAPRQPIDSSVERIGHVYMLRGVIDFITFGVDGFMRKLRTAGFNATVYSYTLEDTVAIRIQREYAQSTTHEPLILVGYSTGAASAIAIAKALNRAHIPVDLLVTLDPVLHEVAPANVKWCVNYYERTVPGVVFFSGTLMRAEPGVKIENIKLERPNHFTIDDNQEVEADVIARMTALCPRRNTVRSSGSAH